jgi:hypothetical protein
MERLHPSGPSLTPCWSLPGIHPPSGPSLTPCWSLPGCAPSLCPTLTLLSEPTFAAPQVHDPEFAPSLDLVLKGRNWGEGGRWHFFLQPKRFRRVLESLSKQLLAPAFYPSIMLPCFQRRCQRSVSSRRRAWSSKDSARSSVALTSTP